MTVSEAAVIPASLAAFVSAEKASSPVSRMALKASKSSGLHDALVDDDLGILAFRAGIGHVRLDRFIGGHLAALGDACFEPRRVADCSDHLLGIENVLDEF